MMKKNIWLIISLILTCMLFFSLKEVEASGPESSAISSRLSDIDGVKIAINLAWTLLCGFLVFNMQAGFAFLGAGFLQRKNTLNYLTMSFMDFCVGAFIFWVCGFALMYGGSGPSLAPGLDWGNSLIGYSGFFLAGDAYDASTSAIWIFNVMFVVATCTIVAGSVAERFKFHAHLIYSMILCGVLYPVYGHWVWGGGWLAHLPFGSGMRDFAGGGVVHGVGCRRSNFFRRGMDGGAKVW